MRNERAQEGYVGVWVSKVANLQMGFEQTWSWQGEVSAALVAEVGAEDEIPIHIEDRTKGHAT